MPHVIDPILATAIEAATRSSEPDEIAGKLTFDGRDSYLAFVAGWKIGYARLSAEIRGVKRSCKGPGDHSVGQARRQSLRRDARRMLVIRAAGRIRARQARAAGSRAALLA